jgi:transposase
MEWTDEQIGELEKLARTAPRPSVRVKALAVLNVARGRSRQEVAAIVCAHRESVGAWVRRYRTEGVAGFQVAPGRGKPRQVDERELEEYLRQSPRHFGVPQTRWTLSALAQTVPSLKGWTPSGVYRALVRLGFRYKRGQPHLHSPDPAYGGKRGAWSRPSRKRGTIPPRS